MTSRKTNARSILFINQFFWPDSSATSQQLTDLAAGMAQSGWQVTVLCAQGGYADAASSVPPRDVRIVHVPARPLARGKLQRVLSYLSFYSNAFFRGLTLPRQDVVVSLTTPPLISLLGTLISLLRGSRHFIYEQDLYPDVAVSLNHFKPDGVFDRVVGFLADWARRRATGVIALGDCMRDRLVMRGVPADRIAVAENWASSQAIEPLPRPGDPGQLVLLYSGNLGLAHDLETLSGAMLALSNDARFRFLFVGAGGRRAELEDFASTNGLRSVEFRPYVSRDRLSEGLALGDIGLVTQRAVCCGSVVPSKVYGILAAARPVLFIGPSAATPALVIARHDCGWQVDPGDTAGLTRLLQHLADNPRLVHEAGLRARQALLQHYDLPQSVSRIEALFSDSLLPEGSILANLPANLVNPRTQP